MVPIDQPEPSDYRVDIYSPSDQPVTASAGVFSFTSAPSIRSQNARGRVFEPTELARELDAAIAANLRELGHGG
ncbi:MAG: hypothetical protein ACYDCI_04300 [Candidatus Limnocylindrales bacterium]